MECDCLYILNLKIDKVIRLTGADRQLIVRIKTILKKETSLGLISLRTTFSAFNIRLAKHPVHTKYNNNKRTK